MLKLILYFFLYRYGKREEIGFSDSDFFLISNFLVVYYDSIIQVNYNNIWLLYHAKKDFLPA